MGAFEILQLLIAYGPGVMKAIQALAPVIKAAEPVIAGLMAKGMSKDEATTRALSTIHPGTSDATEAWMQRASRE